MHFSYHIDHICDNHIFYSGIIPDDIIITLTNYITSLDDITVIISDFFYSYKLLEILNEYSRNFGINNVKYHYIYDNYTEKEYHILLDKLRYDIINGGSIIDFSFLNCKGKFIQYVYYNLLRYQDMPIKYNYYTITSLYYLSYYLSDEVLKRIYFLTSFYETNEINELIKKINQIIGYNGIINSNRKYILSSNAYSSYISIKLLLNSHNNSINYGNKILYYLAKSNLKFNDEYYYYNNNQQLKLSYYFGELKYGQVLSLLPYNDDILHLNLILDNDCPCSTYYDINRKYIGVLFLFDQEQYKDFPDIITESFRIYSTYYKPNYMIVPIIRGFSSNDNQVLEQLNYLINKNVEIIIGGSIGKTQKDVIENRLIETNIYLLSPFISSGLSCYSHTYLVGSSIIEGIQIALDYLNYIHYYNIITFFSRTYIYQSLDELLIQHIKSRFLNNKKIFYFNNITDWISIQNELPNICKTNCGILFLSFDNVFLDALSHFIINSNNNYKQYVLISINPQFNNYFSNSEDFYYVSTLNTSKLSNIGFSHYDEIFDVRIKYMSIAMLSQYLTNIYIENNNLFNYNQPINTPDGEIIINEKKYIIRHYSIRRFIDNSVVYTSVTKLYQQNTHFIYLNIDSCRFNEDIKDYIFAIVLCETSEEYNILKSVGLMANFRKEQIILSKRVLYRILLYTDDDDTNIKNKILEISKEYEISGIFGCFSYKCIISMLEFCDINHFLLWTNYIYTLCSPYYINCGISYKLYYINVIRNFYYQNFYSVAIIKNIEDTEFPLLNNYFYYMNMNVLVIEYNTDKYNNLKNEIINFDKRVLIIILKFIRDDVIKKLEDIDSNNYPIFFPSYNFEVELNYSPLYGKEIYVNSFIYNISEKEGIDFYKVYGLPLDGYVEEGYFVYKRWYDIINTVKSFDKNDIIDYMLKNIITFDDDYYFIYDTQLSGPIVLCLYSEETCKTVNKIKNMANYPLYIYIDIENEKFCKCAFDKTVKCYSEYPVMGVSLPISGISSFIGNGMIISILTSLDFLYSISIFIYFRENIYIFKSI